MIFYLKKIYSFIGFDTAHPNTLLYFIHTTLKNTYRFFFPKNKTKNAIFNHLQINAIKNDSEKFEKNNINKILIIKTDHIGDLILAIPSIVLLRSYFSSAKFSLICNEINKDFAVSSGLFEDVIIAPFDKSRFGPTLQEKNESANILKKIGQFDLAIDMKVDHSSRYTLKHIDANLKCGFYANEAEVELDITCPDIPSELEIHNQSALTLLARLIIDNFEKNSNHESTKQTLLNIARKNNVQIENNSTIKIGFNFGAGNEARCWPEQNFLYLIEKILKTNNVEIYLFGSKSDLPKSNFINSSIKSDKIVNLTGKLSIPQFISAISQIDCFIGHDTGSTHIAASTGCKTICIFSGLGLYYRFKPIGDNVITIRNKTPCLHCGISKIKDCNYDHICMNGISIETVFSVINSTVDNALIYDFFEK
ncbi:glycosyltransferase family 9 protein [Aquitalea sp. LB_tupeE]|uniref:glycosyltransferase family 9 protein n=1 Tax=Aquitalea sp. LB_tupeE TaxID=2748078 RepID=UPI0015BEC69E|nr:glycosyltransferase family 9 protein [Aquitalea sp. LB_tupeE]NWK78267.1 glycosyltransferase family 9 protein [Aquitalea sp. LB_tupeE]